MTWLWIGIGAIILFSLLSDNGNQKKAADTQHNNSHWVHHPHVIDDDDYECSYCHTRFPKEAVVCPQCGASMNGKTEKDEEEWLDEEEELDMLFDDD